MNPLDYIKTLDHHAYFIQAFKNSVQHIKDYLKEKFHIHSAQNPDFFHEKFETLGIDDSRRIKEYHLAKSFSPEGKRIFIIEASTMTHEAQNSLLKIFEEAHVDTHFFIVMPSVHVLLPTLRSRLLIVSPGENVQESASQAVEIVQSAETFLKLSKKDKVTFMDDLAKKNSDEEITKTDIQEFLAALELLIYKKQGLAQARGLKAILKVRDYMNDRSPSVKQLLEYIALSL